MMTIALSKPIREEKGQALIFAILLLLLGSLIITPLMGFMSTGLIAGRTIEERVDEVYAADAGIEDALYNIITPTAPYYAGLQALNVDDTLTLDSIVVNGKDVEVVIELEEDVETFLDGLLGGGAGVHDDWAASSGSPGDGIYTITIEYTGNSANKQLNGVGAWLQGTSYNIRYYEEGHEFEGYPVYYGDLIDDYPDSDFEVIPYGGGTAFIWEWNPPADKPVFGTNPGVFTRSLTFEFTPEEDTPDLYFSWLIGGSMDIGIVSEDVRIEVWKVTATATSATDKETDVIAYVSSQGLPSEPPSVAIITWDIGLQ